MLGYQPRPSALARLLLLLALAGVIGAGITYLVMPRSESPPRDARLVEQPAKGAVAHIWSDRWDDTNRAVRRPGRKSSG